MDLYLLLRISFYAMAGASALSLSIATNNPLFAAGTFIAALLAHFAVDKKKVKPVRIEYIAALGVAVLFYTLLPLREEGAWEKHTPQVFAYFLVAIQPLLFFLPFSALVLLSMFFCGLTLVVISGVMDPNASLLFRMTLFVAVTAWTLFVHALWNARERFSYRASQHSARLSARAKPIMSQPERAMPRRAVYQGLLMIAVLTSLCLIFGLFLFFSTPRLNDTVSYILAWYRSGSNAQPTVGLKGGPGDGPTDVGWSESVSLADLGPIYENDRAAVAVTFTPDAHAAADSTGRVYLRGTVFSDMRDGKWLPSRHKTPLGLPQGGPLELRDSSLGDEITFSAAPIQLQVETLDTMSHYFFATGPMQRISVAQAEMDREGALRLPGEQWVRNYTVWSAAPKFPSNVQLHARAEHPTNSKYVETWLSPQDRARLLPMAVEITKDSATDLGKALAIQMYLRNNPRYQYTLRLDELNRRGDAIVEFLASEDPAQRRGHCSYFASAFVTLCRLKGIPARLAGGFAGTLPDDHAEPAKRVIFKNSDAHAWAEVYFKGEGWVTFDPTPGTGPVNPRIAAEPRVIPSAEGSATASSGGFWSYFSGFDSQQQREMYESIGLALQDGMGDAGDLFSGSSLFGWFGAFIAWVGVGMFVIWISRALMTRSRRRSSASPQLRGRARAAVTFYNDLLQALSRCGFTRKPEQTPREFARHVLQHGGERFRCVMALTDVFERVRYGGGEISQEQFNQLQEALDQLREQSFVLPATTKEN